MYLHLRQLSLRLFPRRKKQDSIRINIPMKILDNLFADLFWAGFVEVVDCAADEGG
jgi:hypothetical protein